MKHHIALLNDDLDSGVIEEKDEVNASLHRIGAMRRSIKEMKQALEAMNHKMVEET